MTEILRWPFRIILYVFLYIGWFMVSLVLLTFLPTMTHLGAVNVVPVGWICIAAAFFADIYFTQLRVKRPQG